MTKISGWEKGKKYFRVLQVVNHCKTLTKSVSVGGWNILHLQNVWEYPPMARQEKGKEPCARGWSWARSFWLDNTETKFKWLYLKRSANMAASRIRKYFFRVCSIILHFLSLLSIICCLYSADRLSSWGSKMTAITSVKRETCFSHTVIFPMNGRIPVARERAIGFVQPAAPVHLCASHRCCGMMERWLIP